MKCKRVITFFGSHLPGSAAGRRLRRAQLHATACAGCGPRVKQMQRDDEQFIELFAPPAAPEGLVHSVVVAWSESRQEGPVAWPLRRVAVYAALLLIAFGGLFLALRPSVEDDVTKIAAFREAVIQGDTGKVKEMLGDDPELVHHQDAQTRNMPLHWAVAHNQVAVVEVLLNSAARVNAKGTKGQTPLHLAAAEGFYDIAKLLLEHGADPTARNDEGLTPLQLAIRGNHLDLIELLKKEKNKNRFKWGESARTEDSSEAVNQDEEEELPEFFIAIRENDWESFIDLLEADPGLANRTTPTGEHPFHYAAKQVRFDMVEHLLDLGADIKGKGYWGQSPLHFVKDEEMIKFLLSQGADIHAKTVWGHTPVLCMVYCEKDLNAAKALLSAGADVNSKNQFGMTMLQVAIQFGYADFALFLLQQDGIELEPSRNSSTTALIGAANAGNLVVVKALLKAGVDVQGKAKASSWTALHAAAREGHAEIVKLLLEHAADPDVQHKEWGTPFDVALVQGHKNVADLLRDHMTTPGFGKEWAQNVRDLHDAIKAEQWDEAMEWIEADPALGNTRLPDRDTPLVLAVRSGRIDAVRFLLAHGANVNKGGKRQISPLMETAMKSRNEIAKLLLKHDADANLRDVDSHAPLHHAALRGNQKLVIALLAAGADVEAAGHKGRTPLHFAAEFGQPEIVRILLDEGAKIDVLDFNRHTPLDYAETKGFPKAAKLLYQHEKEQRTQNVDDLE